MPKLSSGPRGIRDLPGDVLAGVLGGMEPYQRRVLASALGVPPFRHGLTPGDAESAAMNGDYRVMRWISESPGGSVDRYDLMHAATVGGHLRVVEKLFRLKRRDDDIRWVDLMLAAVEFGRLEILAWIVTKTRDRCIGVMILAAVEGNLDVMRLLRDNGFPWDQRVCNFAAKRGHLECLKFAREGGCPWGSSVCLNAAKGGHLECLKYAHEGGCPWDIDTCESAAKGGHLECLEYARERGCPWN